MTDRTNERVEWVPDCAATTGRLHTWQCRTVDAARSGWDWRARRFGFRAFMLPQPRGEEWARETFGRFDRGGASRQAQVGVGWDQRRVEGAHIVPRDETAEVR